MYRTFRFWAFRGCPWRLLALSLLPIILFILYRRSLIAFDTDIRTDDQGTIRDFENMSNRSAENVALSDDQACVFPQLEMNHPSVAWHFKWIKPLVCTAEPNWVYVDNATFRISKEAMKKHGQIVCKYMPFKFETDFVTVEGNPIERMRDGTILQNDFFTVRCNSSDGKTYYNYHSAITYNKEAHECSTKRPLPANAMGLSVFIITFDSISRLMARRKLPKSVSYFTSEMKALELEGYNIVGDGTPAALLPILSGETEEEMQEARRGYKGAKPMDDHPWIFKKYKDAGYVTAWAEDEADVGTFTCRMLGFSKPPVDHYMRTFYVKAFPEYKKFQDYCFGSTTRFSNHLKYFKDAHLMYGHKRKFMLCFHGEYSHSSRKEGLNTIQYADEEFLAFLRDLHKSPYLNNTLLILHSDHGNRFNGLRKTIQGKYEEKLPFWAFRFPPWFEQKYPLAMRNFRTNRKRLVSPFDIYATYLDMLDYKPTHMGNISERGISLFKEIPKERTCAHADVAPHWCACLSWVNVSNGDPIGMAAVQETINVINKATEVHRAECEILALVKVTRIVQYSPNKSTLNFKGMKAAGVPDLSDKMSITGFMYQVTFQVSPGLGMFEATVTHYKDTKSFFVDLKGISRINRYGDAPRCIQREYPYMRPYCYCKK